MTILARELLILFLICSVWTFISTPELAKRLHELQWFKNPEEKEDYLGRARVSRCGVYAMCSSIPLASHIIYPYNWLAVIIVWPLVFGISWRLLKKLGL